MNINTLSNLVITKVHFVSTLYSQKNAKSKRNNRSCWAIVIKYEGETVYTSNGKQYLSDLNHITILPKGCSYEWQCIKTGHFCIIEFESDDVFFEPMSFTIKNSEQILKMFKKLEVNRSLKHPLAEIESIRDTYSIILALMQADNERYLPKEKFKKIAPAIEYISLHYSENISNDTLAAVTGLSTVYFRKLFKNLIECSPIAYVNQMRIEKAKEMLKSDYSTLTSMAQALGYLNLYDFSRAFKKHTGISPSKYAKIKCK